MSRINEETQTWGGAAERPDVRLLLTTNEVISALAISKATLHRMVASSVLAPVHFGRSVRYRLADIEQLAQSGWDRAA